MKDILICKDAGGGTAVLTNYSPMSHYGTPVLRIEANDISGDFGPADMVGDVTAASVVAGWAAQPDRTTEDLQAAIKFLSQWPEGPQAAPVYSTAEAAEALGVSERRIRALCGEGRMGRKVGDTWVIVDEEIKEYKETRRAPGRPRDEEPEYEYPEEPDKLQFTAQRNCMLCGRRFKAEDIIEVETFESLAGLEGKGGPWGYGGFTAADLKRNAEKIVDLGVGQTIFEKSDRR